jgi:hypothetical protein
MKKLKSRKFILSLVLMGVFTLMVWFGKLDTENYMQGMLTLYGVYAGANVATKFFYNKKE